RKSRIHRMGLLGVLLFLFSFSTQASVFTKWIQHFKTEKTFTSPVTLHTLEETRWGKNLLAKLGTTDAADLATYLNESRRGIHSFRWNVLKRLGKIEEAV